MSWFYSQKTYLANSLIQCTRLVIIIIAWILLFAFCWPVTKLSAIPPSIHLQVKCSCTGWIVTLINLSAQQIAITIYWFNIQRTFYRNRIPLVYCELLHHRTGINWRVVAVAVELHIKSLNALLCQPPMDRGNHCCWCKSFLCRWWGGMKWEM